MRLLDLVSLAMTGSKDSSKKGEEQLTSQVLFPSLSYYIILTGIYSSGLRASFSCHRPGGEAGQDSDRVSGRDFKEPDARGLIFGPYSFRLCPCGVSFPGPGFWSVLTPPATNCLLQSGSHSSNNLCEDLQHLEKLICGTSACQFAH